MLDILIGKNLKANGVIYHKNIHFNHVTNLLNNFNNISAHLNISWLFLIYLFDVHNKVQKMLVYPLTSDETVVSLRFILLSLDPSEFRPQNTPVGINEKGFVNSDFGMFLLLDYCIENERGSVGTPLCRVLINISSKS